MEIQKKPHPNEDKREFTLIVHSPKELEPRSFEWLKTLKVAEAAEEAARAFGYLVNGSPYTFQRMTGEVLDRNKPLVAEGLRDGDELELVCMGGGV